MIGAWAVLFIGDRRRGAAGNYGGCSLTCRHCRLCQLPKLEQGCCEAVSEDIEVGHSGAIGVEDRT